MLRASSALSPVDRCTVAPAVHVPETGQVGPIAKDPRRRVWCVVDVYRGRDRSMSWRGHI